MLRRPGGRAHRLVAGQTLVGRAPHARITLGDESVAAEHARLDRDRDELWVTDLGGAGGTRVNHDPVLRSALRPRDEVAFGRVSFTVEYGHVVAWPRVLLLAGLVLVLTGLAAWGRHARQVREPAGGRAVQRGFAAPPGGGAASCGPRPSGQVWYEDAFITDPCRPARPRATAYATPLPPESRFA